MNENYNVPFKKNVVRGNDCPVKVVMIKTRNRSNFVNIT